MFTWHEQFFLIILDLILIPSSIFLAFIIRFLEEDNSFHLILNWVSGIELDHAKALFLESFRLVKDRTAYIVKDIIQLGRFFDLVHE